MSGGPSLYVPSAIAREARQLLGKGAGDSVRQGVELLLKNDLKDIGQNAAGSVDAGSDLQKGLAILANSPFDALGVDVLAGTIDIRKAYKKMALKYHPDKNPNTTPLFQAIQCASEKLSDRGVRRQEVSRYKPSKPSVPIQSPKNSTMNKNRGFNSNSSSNNNRANNSDNEYEKKRQHEAKKAAWRNKCEQERKDGVARQQRQQEEQYKRQQEAKNAYANFEDWDSPQQRHQPSQHQHRYANAAHPQKFDANGRGYSFDDRQQEARDREDARRRKDQEAKSNKFKGDRTYRREGMAKEAAAAKARMEARRGKASASSASPSASAAAARDYMNSYAQNKKNEQVEKQLREQKRREQEANERKYVKPKKCAIPRPAGLTGKIVDQTSVQLEWTKVSYSLATLHVELAYRGCALLSSGAMPNLSSIPWEVANTLISGDKVRKKNLKLKYCYEFRIRYMVSTPSGKKTQDVGEWSQPVRNILVSKQQQQQQERQQKNTNKAAQSRSSSTSGRYAREKKSTNSNAEYSKFYDPNDYNDHSAHNSQHHHQQQQQHHQKQYQQYQHQHHHQHHPDPYDFEDDDDDVIDDSFVYRKGEGYKYNGNANAKAAGSSAKNGHKAHGEKKKKSSLDAADEEVDEDPELDHILSQSARMAWKWGGEKGMAGRPEKEGDYYRRHMSRGSPPPEEVDEDGNYSDDNFEEENAAGAEQGHDGTVYYTLYPPPAHSRGPYIHTVYVDNNRAYRDNARLTEAKKQKMLTVLGFLSSESYVLVNLPFSKDPMGRKADEWLYCQVHWKKKSPSDIMKSKFSKHYAQVHSDQEDDLPWGWVKKSHSTRADNHQFLVPSEEDEEEEIKDEEEEDDEDEEDYDSFNANAGFASYAGGGKQGQGQKQKDNVDIWYEQVDDLGNPYFYNNKTGESRWESPEWVEETDEASGASYFVKLNKDDASPLNSTWSNPGQFARLVRQSSGQS